MKITINKEIIKSLKPCADGYQNYLKHYPDFEGCLEEFLDLEHISNSDKIWVSVRLMPRFLVECFAIDCAISAAAAADDAAYAAAAAYAAHAAADDAAHAAAERQRQIESIIYLIQSHKK